MKPVTLLMFASLMVPAALLAQEPQVKTRALVVTSPIMNRAPTPSTVRTAERFTLVYEVRALRTTGDGDEVVFLRDDFTADKISLGNSFVAEKVTITELPIEDEYRVWKVEIVAYIISPKKSDLAKEIEYKIPPIKFSYLIQPLGEKPEGLKVFEFLSEEVPISYKSSVAENAKYLDIQDDAYGAPPRNSAWEKLLGYYPWSVLLLAIIFAVFQIRKIRRYRAARGASVSFTPEDLIPDEIHSGPTILSRNVARRRFYQSLRELRRNSKASASTEASQREAQRDVRGLVKMLLLSELPGAVVGLGDTEIKDLVTSRVPKGIRQSALGAFADTLLAYKQCIDEGRIGSAFISPDALARETKMLMKLGRKLGWPWNWIANCQLWCRDRFHAVRKLLQRNRR